MARSGILGWVAVLECSMVCVLPMLEAKLSQLIPEVQKAIPDVPP